MHRRTSVFRVGFIGVTATLVTTLLGSAFIACASGETITSEAPESGASSNMPAGDGSTIDRPSTGPSTSGLGAPDGSLDATVPKDATAPKDAGVHDATAPKDATAPQDATAPIDAGVDAASGIDPDLALPGPGLPCTTPGFGAGCPGASMCRIASATGGRCESCTTCGNLDAPCAASNECDILFQCFQGRCTNICLLGTYQCGPIADCINVGHPTHGVCRP